MYRKIFYEDAFILCLEEGWQPEATPHGIGVSWNTVRKVLIRLGEKPIRIHQWTDHCGLLAVPSLNDPGGTHMVYSEGYRIFDPQNGRLGKKWYDYDSKPSWVNFVTDARDKDAAFMARFEMEENLEMIREEPHGK